MWNGKDCDVNVMLLRSAAFQKMTTEEFLALKARIMVVIKDPRTGLCLEDELDKLGVPLTPEEQERRDNQKKKPLNMLVANRQRALIYTGEG